MKDSITTEMRVKMRERVITFEHALRQEQAYCQPSQIIDRDMVPGNVGDYTEEQIDHLIRIERELSGDRVIESEDQRLGRALQRLILGKYLFTTPT